LPFGAQGSAPTSSKKRERLAFQFGGSNDVRDACLGASPRVR
jgi:hypothetical protein